MSETFIGMVENGTFRIISPKSSVSSGNYLTRIQMQESVPPESQQIDLSEFEGGVIAVQGHNGGGWIYSASVVDKGGPILTAMASKVFSEETVEAL